MREVVPEAPPILAEVVEKALIKDKTKRFQSARQMRAALSVARQALEAGRGPNATLAGESQRALREAMKSEPPKTAPDASAPPPFVHGSAALDVQPAPPRVAFREAAPHPRGTGSPRGRSSPGRGKAAARSSVVPLLLGGLGLTGGDRPRPGLRGPEPGPSRGAPRLTRARRPTPPARRWER